MQDKKISKAVQMRQHIAALQSSGLYVEQYCKEQHVKASTYYYWLKKLADDPIAIGSKTNTGTFIQLQPVSQSRSVEIVFTNGVKMYFESLIPVDYLKQLVS